MGFLDKAKEAAAQAQQKAQQGLAQGQAKVGEMQTKRQGDALLHDLGAAYYAQQRSGGSADAVSAALAAIDTHVASNGPLDAGAGAAAPMPPSSYPGAAPPPPRPPGQSPGQATPGQPTPPAQAGGYGLDDL